METDSTQTLDASSVDNNADNAQEGQQGKADAPVMVPKEELDKLQARYDESGKEAKRLADRLETLEKASSLKQEQQQQPMGFPPEEQVIAHLTEKLGFTQDQARHQYQVERFNYDKMNAMDTALKAMQNQIKFSSEQTGRLLGDTNPLAKEATEFCEAIPALKALSIPEKIEQYQAYKSRQIASGRDLSAVKRAAGGASGSGVGGKGTNNGPSTEDQLARDSGFSNAQHMKEVGAATTQEEYDRIARKYKK